MARTRRRGGRADAAAPDGGGHHRRARHDRPRSGRGRDPRRAELPDRPAARPVGGPRAPFRRARHRTTSRSTWSGRSGWGSATIPTSAASPTGVTSPCAPRSASSTKARGRPAIGARFGVLLPETSFGNGLGANALRMFAQMLLSKELGRLTVHANAGLALHDEVFRPHEQRDFFAYGLAAVGRLGSGLSLVGEWAGLAGKGQPGADAHSEAQGRRASRLGTAPRRCGAAAGAAGRRRHLGFYGRGDLAAAVTAASRARRTAAYSISRRTINGSVSSPPAWPSPRPGGSRQPCAVRR